MGAKERLSDLVLKVRHDRKWKFAFLALLAIILFLVLRPSDKRPRRAPTQQQQQQSQSRLTDVNETYEDLIEVFQQDIRETKRRAQQNQEVISDHIEEFNQYSQRSTDVFGKILERLAALEDIPPQQQSIQTQPSVPGEQPQDIAIPEVDSLEPFGVVEEEIILKDEEGAKKKIAFIGAGDSVRVELLAGVNAPTDGTPYPVVFKLIDNVVGPDGSNLPLGEARLIAAAQGSLSDRRALFRLTSLNINFPDNSRKVLDVDGWIVGEDGIRGMEGVLIDPIGKALAGTIVSGAVTGAGQGLSQSQLSQGTRTDGSTFQTFEGDTADFALGQGLARGAQRWSQYIDERVRLLVPHVKVFSGRQGTAIFAQNVNIEGLYEALGNTSNKGSLDFISLD